MAFRIKDLMISEVGPSREGVEQAGTGCRTPTGTGRWTLTGIGCWTATGTGTWTLTGFGCWTATGTGPWTFTGTGCWTPTGTGCWTATTATVAGFTLQAGLCAIPSLPGGAGPTAAGPSAGDPATAPEQLAALKVQLKEAIAQIEQEEAGLESAQKPQTAEEVESLQRKLRDAIDELENLKKELRKKGK